jgi:GNAT superfamily N-acetyltransferase
MKREFETDHPQDGLVRAPSKSTISSTAYSVTSPSRCYMHYPTEEDCSLGPIIPAVRKTPVVGNIGELSVHVVDRSVPQPIRFKLAHVALVAQRAMPHYPAGYDGTVDERDQRLYLLAADDRIVAFVLTALEERFWRLSWDFSRRFKLVDEAPLLRCGFKVARVWVAPERRRRGLALQLLGVTSTHLDCPIAELGWELPFSVDAESLMRRVLPSALLGCGESHTLYETLAGAHKIDMPFNGPDQRRTHP